MAARITAYLVAFIVGTTVIAGLIVGAQREDAPVDLIVVNGSVYTADGSGDAALAEALAVQGNRILLVGSNREVQRLRRPQTVVVDANGGTVLPGFNDTHAELIETGLAASQVSLLGADTLTAVESAIKAWTAANPDREWVIGHGWNSEAFEGGTPTRQSLDALVPDRPVFLVADDGRSGWANSRALNLANVTRRTPNPVGGTIVKDPRTGQPTGVLKNAAMNLVADLIPAATREDRSAALRAAVESAHRHGVTSVHHAGTEEDLELFDSLRRARDLRLRVYATLAGETGMSTAELDRLDELQRKYDDDPVFKAGAIRLTVHDEEDADLLTELVSELDKRGWQLIIEAIGDQAVQLALEAIAFATGANVESERGRRHRVEYVDTKEDVDAAEVSELGVLLDMQPRAGASEQLQDPITGVYAAVNRQLPEGASDGWIPSRRMTLRRAIDVFTRDAAWASFDEHRKGALGRDMLADIVVLSEDIFALPSARLLEAEVVVTIFDGKVVYSRSAESND